MGLKKNDFVVLMKTRRDQLRQRLKEKKLDAFITFDASDCFYLTDFPSEGIFILATPQEHFVFAPGLLYEHVAHFLRGHNDVRVLSQARLLGALEKVIAKQHLKTIGFDSEKLTVGLLEALKPIQATWQPHPYLILNLRAIKDAEELMRLRSACQITSRAVRKIPRQFRKGDTETQLARKLESGFFAEGATKLAFDTIVAFDAHGSYPHHVLTDAKWNGKTPILIDSGAAFRGYCSDLTRTWGFDKMTRKFRQVYDIVLAAQKAGIAAVKDGITAGEVDAVCRDYITKAGFGDFFIHSTGHGVGIDIHEPPRLGLNSKEVLKAGMVVTVEPGIYLPGELGVRIEDTLHVTKTGCETLTDVPNLFETH